MRRLFLLMTCLMVAVASALAADFFYYHECGLRLGETYSMASNLNSFKLSESYHWKSFDTSVATIDKDGMVHALKPGATLIYLVSDSTNNNLDMCVVTVVAKTGDINVDNLIDVGDVACCVDVLLGHNTDFGQLQRADVNGDGAVDVADVSLLVDICLRRTVKKAFKVGDLSFNMVYVQGGYFVVPSPVRYSVRNGLRSTPDNRYYEVYSVSKSIQSELVYIKSFWMAETEYTYKLAKALNPSYTAFDEREDAYADPEKTTALAFLGDHCEQIFKMLKDATGLQFRMPTPAEWVYAATGGLYSQGYKYAGSNDLNEVAWCKGCTDSYQLPDGSYTMFPPVAQKKPNELGLYDMSGLNVEFTNETVSLPINDHPHPTYYTHWRSYGGNYLYGIADLCETNAFLYDRNATLRLVLDSWDGE